MSYKIWLLTCTVRLYQFIGPLVSQYSIHHNNLISMQWPSHIATITDLFLQLKDPQPNSLYIANTDKAQRSDVSVFPDSFSYSDNNIWRVIMEKQDQETASKAF
jgi:hypothetical protein